MLLFEQNFIILKECKPHSSWIQSEWLNFGAGHFLVEGVYFSQFFDLKELSQSFEDFFPPRLNSVKVVMSHPSLSPLPPSTCAPHLSVSFFLLLLFRPPNPPCLFLFPSKPSLFYLLISFHALSIPFFLQELFGIFVLIWYIFNVLPKPSCQTSLSMW